MRKYFKFIAITSVVGGFILVSSVHRFLSFSQIQFLRRSLWLNRHISRLALFVLDIKVDRLKTERFDSTKNYFIVCNHVSYLDVLILNSVLPSCFVTSQEIRESPGLGLITTLAGCIFVERRNKARIEKEIIQLTHTLSSGLNVFVFPEATSTNGDKVLKFKKSLFQASINSQKPVLPVTLNYHSINGVEISLRNRDHLFWYGDMTFLPHLISLCGLQKIHCNLTISNPLEVSDVSSAISLSEIAWDRVSSCYVPKAGSICADDKFLETLSLIR